MHDRQAVPALESAMRIKYGRITTPRRNAGNYAQAQLRHEMPMLSGA
jgi:hypothetical protein